MPVYMGTQGCGCFLLAPFAVNQRARLDEKALRRRGSADSILGTMGERSMYNGYLPVRIIHRTNVERLGDAGEVILDDNQISFNAAHIPFARKNSKFTIDNQTLTLKTPLTKSKEGLQVWVAT